MLLEMAKPLKILVGAPQLMKLATMSPTCLTQITTDFDPHRTLDQALWLPAITTTHVRHAH